MFVHVKLIYAPSSIPGSSTSESPGQRANLKPGLSYVNICVNRLHEKRFMRSVEFRLDGTLPATKSAALRNSYGYRYLLTCNLSPALLSYKCGETVYTPVFSDQ